MVLYITEIKVDGYEKVIRGIDSEAGLDCIVAVHSTKLGPAMGGCRLWSYPDFDAHLTDALRLSQGMTMKNSLAGLDGGGGKGVINCKAENKTLKLLHSYGEVVDSLGGSYYTAEDVGMSTEDLENVGTKTKYVLGHDVDLPSNPSPATAFGVIRGMKTAVDFLGISSNNVLPHNSLNGISVNIQGIGSVGWALMEMLLWKGARVTVTDINKNILQKAKEQHNVNVVEPEDIYNVPCDIFSPCALGATINKKTIRTMTKKAKIICGSANNQLEKPSDDQLVFDAGIIYCPDYLVNAGGVILSYKDFSLVDTDFHVANFVDMISDRLELVLTKSKRTNVPTGELAEQLAFERLI